MTEAAHTKPTYAEKQARHAGFLDASKYIPSDFTRRHIEHALDLAIKATKEGSPEHNQARYALRLLDRLPRPSGCFVDGREVPVDSIYSDADRQEMQQFGTN